MIPGLVSFAAAPWLRPAALALALAAAAAGGAWVTAAVKDGQAASARAEASETALQVVIAQQQRLRAARERGDRLALEAAAQEERLKNQAEEQAREIRRLTTGRPCLGGAVVRLLNESATPVGAGVPTPAGEPAGADGAAASDTDVALWAGTCRRAYDTCRNRLDAVRVFFDGAP